MTEAAVTLERITHSVGEGRKRRTLFSDFSCTFESGKSYLISGPSGAGKTTLLSIIGALIPPDKGTVKIFGNPVKYDDVHSYRSQFSYLFQSPRYFEDVTLKENIKYFKILYNSDKETDKLLEELKISHLLNKKFGKLSVGERLRSGILFMLIQDKPVILADEPTGSVDYENKEAILNLLLDHCKNRTLIIVSHDLSLVNVLDHHISLENL